MRIKRPYERMAQEYEGRVACWQMCMEDCPNFARELGVRSMPTFVVFSKGKRVDHFATSDRDVLEEVVSDYL